MRNDRSGFNFTVHAIIQQVESFKNTLKNYNFINYLVLRENNNLIEGILIIMKSKALNAINYFS